MKSRKKKFSWLAILLAISMTASVLPVTSMKAATITENVVYEVFAANDYEVSSGQVTGTSLNEDWDKNLVKSNNVSMQTAAGWFGTEGNSASNHDSRNALYSTNDGGYAIFKVPMEENATIKSIVVNTRFCAGTTAKFSISNEQNGTYVGNFSIEESASGTDQTVDVSEAVAGWENIYVKVEFPNTACADWAALWNIRAEGTAEVVVEDDADDDDEKDTVEEPVVYEVFAANDYEVSSGQVTGTSLNEDWNKNLVESNNVSMQTAAGWFGTEGNSASNHDSRNALYSTNDGGYAIFKVPMEENATIKSIVVNTRFCAGTTAKFSISNEQNGTYVGDFSIEESASGTDQTVDVSEAVAGWENIYVKVEFPNTACADWAALWNIRAEGTVEVVVEDDTDDNDVKVTVEEPVEYEVFAANDYEVSSGEITSTSLNEDWDKNLVESNNVSMQTAAGWFGTEGNNASNHVSRNALYSTNDGGYAIFKVPMEDGVTIKSLVINTRFCAGTTAKFSVSNEQNGTYVGDFSIEESASGTDQTVDISEAVADWENIYVKVEFPNTLCADWAALWNIRAEGIKLVEYPAVEETVIMDVFAANNYEVQSGEITSTSLNEDWDKNLVESNNVSMQTAAGWFGTEGNNASNHVSRNALYSTNDGGYVIFKVPMEDGVTIKSLVINTRFCAGTTAKFSISNEQNGTYVGNFSIEESASGTDQTVDISEAAADWENIYVKVEFPNTLCADWAAVWNIRAIGTKLVADTGSEEEIFDNPTDQLDSAVVTWKVGKEDAYGLDSTGLAREDVTAEVGNVSQDYNVLKLASGQSMEFILPAEVGTDTNVTMEIREIHMHGDKDIAYTVSLNNNLVQERVVTPLSEGATHVWVDYAKSALDKENDNVITITNTGEQEVRFESIWFYENLDALLIEEDVYRPLEVVLFTIPVGYSDYDADLKTVLKYKEDFSGYNKYTVGMAFDIYYMKWEEKVLYERIDWLMQLAVDADMPLYLDLNSWWSGTSQGMDGQGGFWTDINYQQIIYDPDNVNGQGIWQLSTPNMWGNTPWLTLNSDWYNQVRNEKLEDLSDYISKKQAEYQAAGEDIDVNIFMENEPIYWAYKHYNSTSEDGRADLSYLVIQDALADGVNLDPTDGLTGEEQLWLFNNLTNYIEAEGDAVMSGLGNDSIIIVNDEVTYPTSQLSEKTYSHIPVRNTNESTTVEGIYYPFWEWHVVDDLQIGLEYASAAELTETDLTYVVARGTYADVNIERSAINNANLLNQLYSFGADYAIIFNVASTDHSLIKATDSELTEIQDNVNSRSRNLWISCRADVEEMMADLDSKVARASSQEYREAKEAYADGRYKTAYSLLLQVQSTASLPIDFTVSGTSTLIDYPVTVETESGSIVNITLYEAGTTLELRLTAETADEVKVKWTDASSYTVTDLGDGLYRFTKGGNKSGAVTLTCAPYYEKDYPDKIEAVFKGYSEDTISITSQDATVSEYVDSVKLVIADDCTITREADGDVSSRESVEVSELQKYDLLYLTLNEDDEVTSIKAIYGEVVGRVVSVTYPVVDGTEGLENPYITIKDSDGTLYEFELCAITSFDYPTMTGNNIQTSDLTDYGLEEGDKIRISYSPYQWEDSSIKAIKVYKIDYTTNVLDVTFEDGTLEEPYYAENVHVSRLDSNYSNMVATAQDKDKLGVLIWKVTQEGDMAIGDMTIEFACRSILGTSLNLYMSDDNGETWTKIGTNELDGSFQSIQKILVEDIAANSILVKVEMDSIGTGDPDTWSSLDQISINIPSADLVAAQAVDELILAIGEVTINSGDAIETAREAYNALTDAQKQIVENDDILKAAEEAYNALINGDDNQGGEDGSQGGTDDNQGGTDDGQGGTDNNQGSSDGTQEDAGSKDEDSNDSIATGDGAKIMLYILLSVISILCVAAVVFEQKSKTRGI